MLALQELLSDRTPPDVRLRAVKHVLRLNGVDQRRNNPHARSNVRGPKWKPPAELPAASPDVEIEALLEKLSKD